MTRSPKVFVVTIGLFTTVWFTEQAVAGETALQKIESATKVLASKTCSSGFKHAIIGGTHKCLRPAQFCSRRFKKQYERYGFACVPQNRRHKLCSGAFGGRFDNGEWLIEKGSATTPEEPFEIRINGVSIGSTKVLSFANRVGDTGRFPQVVAIYSSGFLRLKPGADPDPPIPFGQSLVLGPAIFGTSASFPGAARLFFNPQLQRVSIDTCRLKKDGRGRLLIKLTARDNGLAPASDKTNQIMNMRWKVALSEPSEERTRIRVSGSFAFTEEVRPDLTRTAELQSFRVLQISSMFIDAARHDVDAFRFRGPSGPVTVAYDPTSTNTLLPPSPLPLEGKQPILDSLHTDDVGQPNGNTPSNRITVNRSSGPAAGPLTPRAFITPSQDLNDDNLGLWLHQRPRAVIAKGARGRIRFTLIATADPLDAAQRDASTNPTSPLTAGLAPP